MEFGVFFQMQVPRPWDAGSESRVLHDHLEQARVADGLGFGYVWSTEHHFLAEYSHSSAPEVLLAAVAAQTSRIRIGHGIVVCVPEVNHPVRVAERCAFLDVLSGGRLEVGTGRSGTWTELSGFGADPDATKRAWDEFVRILPGMWTQEVFRHSGMVDIPERAVLPKPVQKPHPPLWVAVTAPGTELDAAARGLGCLWLGTASFAQQEQRTAEYKRRLQHAEPVGAVNSRSMAMNFLYCHQDPAVAAARGRAFLDGFNALNRPLVFAREVYPTSAYKLRGNLIEPPAPKPGAPDETRPIPEGACIGTPGQIIDTLKKWEATGLDGINFVINGANTLTQTEILTSLRLFATEVMPAFTPKTTTPAN